MHIISVARRPAHDRTARPVLERMPHTLSRPASPVIASLVVGQWPAILYEVMSRLTVYTTDPCSFCTRVKALLSTHGVEFAEVNLSKDPDGRLELVRETGMMSFPQVLLDGRLLGGWAEVKAAADSGRLDELLAA
jgi:glutaredoxin 3